jgi:hypothetical protein
MTPLSTWPRPALITLGVLLLAAVLGWGFVLPPLSRLFRRMRGSGGEEHTTSEKVELGTPEGLPLQ